MKKNFLNPIFGAISALAPLCDRGIDPQELAKAVMEEARALALDSEAKEAEALAAVSILWRKTGDVALTMSNACDDIGQRRQWFQMGKEAHETALEALRNLNECKARVRDRYRVETRLDAPNWKVDLNEVEVRRAQFAARALLETKMEWVFCTPEDQKALLDKAQKAGIWAHILGEPVEDRLPKLPNYALEKFAGVG